MKKFAKCALACLSATLHFATSCGKNKDGDPAATGLTEADVTVWGAPVTEKVLQDKSLKEYYTEIQTDAKMNLLMAKGEYEGAQVIVSPSKDVPYYNVSVTDLTHEDGTAKITKDKIGVYKQKYLPVTALFNRPGVEMGMYPDAILPFEAAVKYEENNIEENLNQGIYMNVETALDQTAGTYTGTMTIDFKEFKKDIPITVTVVNAVVSEENNAKSCVLNSWNYAHGELDSTQAMRDKYTEALVKYRLAPSTLVTENNHTAANIEDYVEKAYEYMLNPRFSNCSIPYKTSSLTYEGDGGKYDSIDPDVFEAYLYAFAEKSFETGMNMFDKLVLYNAIIDEPDDRGMTSIVNLNCKVFNNTVEKVADAIEADDTIESSIKADVVDGIRKIPHIVTNSYSSKWGDRTGDEYVNTFCPLSNGYDGEAMREQYDVQDERWWYVCNNPYFPYPNWQIEDSDLLAPRVMGWMQAEYDITGVLYWGCNAYDYYDMAAGEAVANEDYYGANAKRTKHNSSGEGVLFYPGGQYGLDEPVGSLRLEAIRDGLEDYELLLSLKETYKEQGFSSDSLTKTMNSLLYSGSQVAATTDEYTTARASLLSLCEMVSSPAKMCIVDSQDQGDGKIVSKIFLKNGYTLKQDGNAVSGGVVSGEGYIYTVESGLSADRNYLNLSVDADGVTYTYQQALGGKATAIKGSTLVSGITSKLVEVNASIVSKEEIGLTGETVKVVVGAATEKSQRLQIKLSEISDIGEQTSKVVFRIYNPTSVDIPVKATVRYEKKTQLSDLTSNAVLKANEYTLVEANFATTTWSMMGGVKDFYLYFGNTSNEAAKTLYLDCFTIYNK